MDKNAYHPFKTPNKKYTVKHITSIDMREQTMRFTLQDSKKIIVRLSTMA